MSQPRLHDQGNEALEVSRMFTWAIEQTFRTNRTVSLEDERLNTGKRRQEATAQALLDYILQQGDEASKFAQAFRLSHVKNLNVAKEATLNTRRRVDHALYCGDDLVAYIEDKIWAKFGNNQLRDYTSEIQEQNINGKLLVLVPSHRINEATAEIASNGLEDSAIPEAWIELPHRLRKVKSKNLHLWQALGTFAEEVGVADLTDIAHKESFTYSTGVAKEIEKYLETCSQVADCYIRERARVSNTTPSRSQFSFSTNRRRERPWLQVGVTTPGDWGSKSIQTRPG